MMRKSRETRETREIREIRETHDKLDPTEAAAKLRTRRRKHMAEFIERVFDKLEVGERAYGSASFSKSIDKLLDEILEELVDVAGWGAVLAVRVIEMKAAVAKVSQAVEQSQTRVSRVTNKRRRRR